MNHIKIAHSRKTLHNVLILAITLILLAGLLFGIFALIQSLSVQEEDDVPTLSSEYPYLERLTDQELNALSQKDITYDVFGKSKRTTLGIVLDVSEKKRTVDVMLPEKRVVHFDITDETLIGKALQEMDEHGMILRESAESVHEDLIYALFPGTHVLVTYFPDDVQDGHVLVQEFVMY